MIAQFPIMAFRNRRLLQMSTAAGCFRCLKRFPPADVQHYTDNGETALCPHCGVEAVVGDNGGSVPLAGLQQAHDFWYGVSTTAPSSPPSGGGPTPDASEKTTPDPPEKTPATGEQRPT